MSFFGSLLFAMNLELHDFQPSGHATWLCLAAAATYTACGFYDASNEGVVVVVVARFEERGLRFRDFV